MRALGCREGFAPDGIIAIDARRGACTASAAKAEPSCPGRAHGCPVRLGWTRGMALILLGIDVLADVLVMPAQATLFSRLLQHLPWSVLNRAVVAHEMDKGHRVLDARSHLVALMAGQLIEAHGLRDIEAALAAHAPALKRRRIEPACRSTLADANKVRSPAAFEGLIPAL